MYIFVNLALYTISQRIGVATKSFYIHVGKRIWLRNTDLKGIVSQDFELYFLTPLDSSDSATLDGTGSFFFKVVKFLIIRALAVVVFPVSESRLRERPQLTS
jgi:hypothetical protein